MVRRRNGGEAATQPENGVEVARFGVLGNDMKSLVTGLKQDQRFVSHLLIYLFHPFFVCVFFPSALPPHSCSSPAMSGAPLLTSSAANMQSHADAMMSFDICIQSWCRLFRGSLF